MIKLLVETKGAFQLQDLGHKGQLAWAHRPSVVENSNFIQDRIGRSQLRILGELKDEATDGEFEKFVTESDKDMALAVSSFLEAYGSEAVEEDEPKKSARGGRKPAARDSDKTE
ncbi:MAG: hypothetical protein K5863_08975 [Nitratireductor sp.]|uniref:hypothetical protein n=1 Tax=Nitratireductor TaxID=245876 RepID=UPI0026170064|nr:MULTISPECIES: hypothetical protein [Nitratireductor]MCV0350196.1 hypothetical protein [Nitratireductor sp.]MDV2968705.1 hypothetical protein [Nitratireductor aquimarinus]